jgi:hypothetical protein
VVPAQKRDPMLIPGRLLTRQVPREDPQARRVMTENGCMLFTLSPSTQSR